MSFRPQGEIFYRFLTAFGMTPVNGRNDAGKKKAQFMTVFSIVSTGINCAFLSFRPQGEIFYRFLTAFGMTIIFKKSAECGYPCLRNAGSISQRMPSGFKLKIKILIIAGSYKKKNFRFLCLKPFMNPEKKLGKPTCPCMESF